MAHQPSRRQEQAERFRRFRQHYGRTRNAYQSALAAGYSERMARSKSYQLARLVKTARRLERLRLPAEAESPDSHRAASVPLTAENSGVTAAGPPGASYHPAGRSAAENAPA